ncbi:MAG: type II secretion system protein [Gammaproteobacteria bacterium]|nr:type II secretion system protein [Gammaproteobacteria bacterium]
MRIKQPKGFTLLELIVVVALAGIIVSSILLSTSLINPHQNLKDWSNKTGKLIRFVQQNAILNNQNYAISFSKKGYQFLIFEQGEWVKTKEKMLKVKALGDRYKATLIINEQNITPKNEKKLTPHILILASAEMTPFKWVVEDLDGGGITTLSGQFNGDVSVEFLEPVE